MDYTKTLNLHIQFPKRYCNFNCPYCFQGKHINPTKDQKAIVNKKFALIFKNVNKIIENSKYEKVILTLLGGEITLFDLDLFFSFLKNSSKQITIKIMTNAAMPMSYYSNLFSKHKNLNFRINISYHKDFMSYNVYRKKMLEFKKLKKEFSNIEYIKTNFVLANEISIFLIWKIYFFNHIHNFGLRFIAKEEKQKIQKLDFLHHFFYEINKIKHTKLNGITKKMYKKEQVYNFENTICIPEYTIDETGAIKPDCNIPIKEKKNIFNIDNIEEIISKKIKCTLKRCSCLNFVYNSLGE